MTKKFSIGWILKEYVVLFKRINISKNLVEERFNEYFELHPNGKGKDFIWSLFQFLILETANNSKNEYEMYTKQEPIYLAMSTFRRKYENSMANELKRLSLDSYLGSLEPEDYFKMSVEVISGHCCEYCDSMNGERYELENVRKNRYLASEKCTREFGCNCCYAYIPERDENDNLINLEEI